MPCEVPDEQIGKIVSAIVLPDAWVDRVLAQVQLADEVKRTEKEREQVRQRLGRLGQTYVDGLVTPEDYKRQKQLLDEKLRSLVVPDADAALDAGQILQDLPELWGRADLSERRRILMTMLSAVYVDTVEEKRVVAIRPKPAFRALFEIATTRKDRGVVLVSEPGHENPSTPAPDGQGVDGFLCFWWRRGRAYLHLEHELRLAGLEIDGGVGIVGSGGRGKGRHSRLPLRQVVRIGVPSVEGRQLRRHFDALRRMRV